MKTRKTLVGAALCCAAALLGTAAYAASPAFAANADAVDDISYVSLDEDSTIETFEIPSDGKVGDQYINGDMIIEIVTKEEVERVANEDVSYSVTEGATVPREDADDQVDEDSGRMARVIIMSGEPYVSTEDEPTETFEIPSDGKVGEQYINGDMIIEIVTKEEVERVVSEDMGD